MGDDAGRQAPRHPVARPGGPHPASSSNVLLIDGADFDTATYLDATTHVTVHVGDGPGEGRAGDSDEIRDAERVI